MPTIAAIDVGSNAMRLVVGIVDRDRTLTILESIRDPVRLGGDVFRNGFIAEETLDKTADAFQRFKSVLESHAVTWTRAVATSAAREAANREIFLDRVAQASGIEVTLINAEEEARLIYRGVESRLNLKNRLAMLIDIGGGSVEVTLAESGNVISTETFRMGAVRLLQVLEEQKHGETRFNQLVREYVEASHKRIKKEIGTRTIDLCVGTGGNIEALGDMRREVLGKEKNTLITLDELGTLVKKLQSMTFEERIQKLLLRPDRADVIVPASMVLHKVAHQAGVAEVQIPHVGLKDGIIVDMIEELYGERKHAYRDQVIASAMQIGRKYLFDEQHATTVAGFAARLFDETRALHSLTLEYKLVLEVSALLHDIGHFISVSDHHKHSWYILNANPVIGLTQSQMALVANVARYHRKSSPKPEHEPYRVLSSKDRVIVSKLSALLRLADALDNEHSSRVTDISVEFKKPRLTMRLKGDGDLLLEKWALAKKATMFEGVFSTKLVVEDA